MLDHQRAFLRKHVPPIPPVSRKVTARPFWSVLIPVYRRADLLEQALRSVLGQDRGPDAMEIVVLDDASPDTAIADAVRRIGGARVDYRRQPRNLGQFANVNDGIRRATGHWIHVLHDDDWVEDAFYARLEEHLTIDGAFGAALTAVDIVGPERELYKTWIPLLDAPGEIVDALARFATSAAVQTPAVVVRRDVYETLGGYNPAFAWPGDWEMWQRIASHYRWWFEPRARACYREHGSSISDSAKRTGRNIAEVRDVIAFAQNYLPPEHAPALRGHALFYWAQFALRMARRMVRAGQYEAAAAQISEALRTEPSERIVRAVMAMERYLGGEGRGSSR